MVPLSVLGQLRREMVEQLESSLPQPVRTILPTSGLQLLRSKIAPPEPPSVTSFRILCRTPEQVRSLVDQIDASRSSQRTLNWELIADFQDLREYREAISHARSKSVVLWTATPRIQKAGEMDCFG